MNVKRCPKILFLLCFIACVAAVSSASSWREDVIANLGGEPSWTVMLYLDGDEISMEQDFVAAFRNMAEAKAGSSANVNIVVQFDRLPDNVTDYGDWSITHRFYLTPGLEPTEENAIADWGDGKGGREVDMADPDTLLDFVNWTISNYPADKYALVIGDHGYGWKGMAVDTTSHGDFLKVKELKDALTSVPVMIDLLAFDACLMQMVEVAYELRNTGVGIIVGSELPGTTWPFAEIVSALTDNPSISPRDLGARINDLYFEAHADVTKIGPLAEAIGNFAAVSIAGSSDDIVRERAETVVDNIEQAVVYSRNSADWEGYVSGLSIFFPLEDTLESNKIVLGVGSSIPPEFFYFYTRQITGFAEETLWRDLLFLFYNMDERISGALFKARFAIQDEGRAIDNENVDLYDLFRRVVENLKLEE
ncbi:MAG: hypothetical protein JRK53_05545 [Deltaproteobacteria bacterium]|nr:hypothetical protein [Deltaproteobacteria bacterium]